MIKKLKQGIKTIWQKIKNQVDFEHLGFHLDNCTKLVVSTFGVLVFGAVAFIEYCYFPIVQAQVRTAPGVAGGDVLGALFSSWPLVSFALAEGVFVVGALWSLFEFTKSFSFYDSYHRRVIELRAKINDVECGIGGDGRHNEWLTKLKFQDSDEARKVANFVFLGRQLDFRSKRVKEIVEAKFGKE